MNVWFTADTHFNHTKVLTFESTTRDFDSIEEHDEKMIENWNSRVRPKDIIWHLGDVYLGKDVVHFHQTMKRLNGSKRLIRGNHDTFPTEDYLFAFDEIYGVWPKYGFVMSHVPLHPESVARWGLNVHGHLHSKTIDRQVREGFFTVPRQDTNYLCVSVEQHNLAPISLDEIRLLRPTGGEDKIP